MRESGQPGEEDKRTLTKQPTCKLMECKLRLLQVLRELTAMGRQAVVWYSGRLALPLASAPPRWEEHPETRSLGFLLTEERWEGVQHVQVSLSLRPRGQESEVRDRGASIPSPEPWGSTEHVPPPSSTHTVPSLGLRAPTPALPS